MSKTLASWLLFETLQKIAIIEPRTIGAQLTLVFIQSRKSRLQSGANNRVRQVAEKT